MSSENGKRGIEVSRAGDVTAREDEGLAVHINDENGEPTDVIITVVGTYSKRYRAADRSRDNRLFKPGSRVAGSQLTDTTDLVAACILGWEGFTLNDEPHPFTRENAIALITAAPWIREQLVLAMNDHAAFLKKASTP